MEMKTNIPKVIQTFLTAYNAMNIADMMACLHEEAVFENVSNYHPNMQWKGLEAIQTLAETSAAAFASRQQKILHCVISENECVLQVEFAGVPLVDLPNGMKAGEATIVRGASFFTIKDEKIIKLMDFS